MYVSTSRLDQSTSLYLVSSAWIWESCSLSLEVSVSNACLLCRASATNLFWREMSASSCVFLFGGFGRSLLLNLLRGSRFRGHFRRGEVRCESVFWGRIRLGLLVHTP